MSQNNSEGIRKPVLYGVIVLVVAAVGGVILSPKKKEPEPAAAPAPPTEVATQPGYTRPKPLHTVTGTGEPEPAPTPPADSLPANSASATPRPPATPPTVPAVRLPEPTPETRALVSALANLDLKSTPLTPEAAAAWKDSLGRLAQSGAAGLPAIQEFLALNKDIAFDAVPGAAALLGSSSLRLSLLEALGNVNTPDGLALSSQILQSTTDPREIALLAQNLERNAPEQYREAALAAARGAMAEAAAGRLTGKDVGPLFDVLARYGGANAVADFQQAASSPYKYYATIALADLPEGAGVPALVQMVTDPKNQAVGSRIAALQALAQLSPDHADARNVLMEQARQGTIPGATWINIASSLSGDKFQIGNPTTANNPNLRTWHLSYGNQNYFASPGPLTADQVQQRLGLVDQFLTVNANNPIAQTALQDARNKLTARQGTGTQ